MTYMYCSSCSKVTPASIARIAFSTSIKCSSCGNKPNLSQMTKQICPDCNSELYAPKSMDMAPSCPCRDVLAVGSAAENESPKTPELPKAPETPKYPPIKCPRCEAQLPSTDGLYGSCPVCQHVPSQEYITKQLYMLTHPQAPIQVRWDPKPNEMVYVHHHSSDIPANSVLIVNPNQQSAYISGGQMVVLNSGQTYALFNADLDTETIAKGINDKTLTLPPLALKINTKVIFFDNRKHEVPISVSSVIADGAWNIKLPAIIDVQVCNPECLLRNAIDLYDGDNVSEYLQGKAVSAISKELISELVYISPEEITEAENEMQMRRLLRNLISDHEEKILSRVNRRLTEQYGIDIAYLDITYHEADCRRG